MDNVILNQNKLKFYKKKFLYSFQKKEIYDNFYNCQKIEISSIYLNIIQKKILKKSFDIIKFFERKKIKNQLYLNRFICYK